MSRDDPPIPEGAAGASPASGVQPWGPPPHGGRLTELLVEPHGAADLRRDAASLPVWWLTEPQLLDLELLLSGAFSPLTGFLTRREHESVTRAMRLGDGALWPIPVTLDVPAHFVTSSRVAPGCRLALLHPEGLPLAVLEVEDVWSPDRLREAQDVYGTTSVAHPGVFRLLHETQPVYVGGRVVGIDLPEHHTFPSLRHTPRTLRALFRRHGCRRVVALQTRNPLHRAHVELLRRAMDDVAGHGLIHPAVGRTQPGDTAYVSRVRCYQHVLGKLPPGRTFLSLLPLAMRMAGPREALWHAILRQNFGCSHFIVGRDHAGPAADPATGTPWYPPYAAQELVARHQAELAIQMLPLEELVFVADLGEYRPRSEVPPGARVLGVSGTELRRRLRAGEDVPAWFSYPQVLDELRRAHPPPSRQGFTVFLTGLSGAGKSTIAKVLAGKLLEHGGRPVTLLDGDVVRRHLSSELGFSREHRDLNVSRIAFVASEITKNGGAALCAPIAPYDGARRRARALVEEHGGFVLVHVATPLAVCEQRDRKGLYAKARAGKLPGFTGIDDPYEVPTDAEVVLDATTQSPEAAAEAVIAHLTREGYLGPSG